MSGNPLRREDRQLRSVGTSASDVPRLLHELRRLEEARHVLVERAERTLVALALTLDAQAATQLLLEGAVVSAPDGVADLEGAARRCRAMIQELSGTDH